MKSKKGHIKIKVPYDGLLKRFLEEPSLLKSFLYFAGYQSLADKIDFTKEIRCLNTDVNTIYVITSNGKKRYADVVLEVKYKNGEEKIIHLEPQSFADKFFPERVSEYHREIERKTGKDVISIALCFKKYQMNNPTSFTKTYELNQKRTLEFNQIHLNNFKMKDYLETENLAAIVLLPLMKNGTRKKKISNIDLYLRCLENLHKIYLNDGIDLKNQYLIFEIIFGCLNAFIKLNDEEKIKAKEKHKELFEGEEVYMKMVTLFNEDTLKESKIESIVNFLRKDLKSVPDKDSILAKLEKSLKNINDVSRIRTLEIFFSDENITVTQTIDKINEIANIKRS